MSNMKMINSYQGEEEHIYYDLKIKNIYNRSKPDDKYIPFIVKDETSMILNKQSDYKMAIHSFMLNMDTPLCIYPIQEGIDQTDVNKSIYSICITYNGNDYMDWIYFQPAVNLPKNPFIASVLPPSENNGIQDFSTGYYYLYDYYSWVNMMNTCFIRLTTTINLGNSGTPFPNPPQMVYENEKFTIIYPKEIYSTGATIFFNEALGLDLGGFPTKLNEYNNDAGKTRQLIIPPINDPMAYIYRNPNDNVPEATPKYYKISQEYDLRYRFNGVAQIVLTSDYLSVRKEYYPDTSNPNNSAIQNYQQFNTPSLPIIASFSMIDEGGSSWVQTQNYQPAFYKWIDLVGSQPLKEVDIKVFYQLNRGSLVQAYIPINSMSIIKFVFKKKGDMD